MISGDRFALAALWLRINWDSNFSREPALPRKNIVFHKECSKTGFHSDSFQNIGTYYKNAKQRISGMYGSSCVQKYSSRITDWSFVDYLDMPLIKKLATLFIFLSMMNGSGAVFVHAP